MMMITTIIPDITEKMIMRTNNDTTEERGIDTATITNFEEKIDSFRSLTVTDQDMITKMNTNEEWIIEADHTGKIQDQIISTETMEGFNITFYYKLNINIEI